MCVVPSCSVMLVQAQPQPSDEYQRASEPLPSTLRVVPEVSLTGDAAIESSAQTDHWRRSSH